MTDSFASVLASILASIPPGEDGLPPEIADIDPAAPFQWAWSEPDAEGLRSFRCGCGITLVWGPRDGLTLAQVEASHRRECAAARG